MVPASKNTRCRVKNLYSQDYDLQVSKTGSGFARRMSNWKNREWVYPSNVVYLATSQKNKGHSACFPDDLPRWFIKLFTKEGNNGTRPVHGIGDYQFGSKRNE